MLLVRNQLYCCFLMWLNNNIGTFPPSLGLAAISIWELWTPVDSGLSSELGWGLAWIKGIHRQAQDILPFISPIPPPPPNCFRVIEMVRHVLSAFFPISYFSWSPYQRSRKDGMNGQCVGMRKETLDLAPHHYISMAEFDTLFPLQTIFSFSLNKL